MRPADELERAIERDDLVEVKRLIEEGVDLHQMGPSDGTPLAVAASLGRREIVKHLLSAGAEPDMGGCLSALGLASAKGFDEVCAMLLAAGADPNLEDTEGSAPFQSAVFSGNRRILEMLVKAGATTEPLEEYLEYARDRNSNGSHDAAIVYLEQLAP
jgi:uncharacterized protein